MFGRKDTVEPTDTSATQDPNNNPAARAADASRGMTSTSPASGTRRSLDMPHGSSSRPRASDRSDTGERKLTVGKGLSLSGEITSCDVLVVEGKVEAKLTDGKLLEITESGQFRGSVEIENADIAGRYDGDLTVHGRLTVRGTGRISGIIKYGELEVNAGGQIIGEMQVVGGGAGAQAQSPHNHSGRSFKSAAKFAASGEEDEEALFARKANNG